MLDRLIDVLMWVFVDTVYILIAFVVIAAICTIIYEIIKRNRK